MGCIFCSKQDNSLCSNELAVLVRTMQTDDLTKISHVNVDKLALVSYANGWVQKLSFVSQSNDQRSDRTKGV